ncbi:MAG: hypothetical protein HQL96_10580 [Magnetococcales bacterium]|nr:hypothetical protein [Magnetococcales bacterium]
MTVRRLEKSGKTLARSAAAQAKHSAQSLDGANFSKSLAALTGIQETIPLLATLSAGAVSTAERAPTPYQRRQQTEQATDLLDSLEALGRDLINDELVEPDETRKRLRETRDQALHSLSTAPENGHERDLLHRTAVLATVELAKTDRGDYK